MFEERRTSDTAHCGLLKLVSDQLIVDAIISKYSNYCTLYRQSAILLRDAGMDISRATIDGWVMRVGDLRYLLERAGLDICCRGSAATMA